MRANERIDELVANALEGTLDVYNYLAVIRDLDRKIAIDVAVAGPHLRSLLLYTPTGDHTTPRRAAKRVANGFKRVSELHIAAAAMSTKTWAAMCQDFMIKSSKSPAKKKGLKIDL